MLDVIETEVFNKLFASIAEEMGIILTRSSFSPNIKERRDFSCAIFDGDGRLVAQASHIPVHLGSMPATLKAVLKTLLLAEGDIVIVNDPFHGGSHLPDITLAEGIFAKDSDTPVYYVVNRAHHADVGGQAPGSMGLCSTINEEGVRIEPTYLRRNGKNNQSFLTAFLKQVRNPEERLGDLRAQQAALACGKQRLTGLLQRYGRRHLSEVQDELFAYASRLMQKIIESIPDGRYSFTDYLDDDGMGNRNPVPVSVDLGINGPCAVVDFSRSSDQLAGPLNTVEAVTVSAAVYVFQALLGDGFPINHGSYQPITVICRPGSLLNAQPPSAVAAGNVETSQRIVDVLFGALALAIPDRIPAASCGSMNNLAISGIRPDGSPFSYYETIGGGMGARPDSNGLSGIHTHMTNTMNTPVEALEHGYPFEIVRYGLRHHSGGNGLFVGGDGIIRAYRFLSEARVALLSERRQTAPYGLQGGEAGEKGENWLVREGKHKKIPGKTVFHVFPGDLLYIKTPGGGGWGHTV
jgi:N-methylhydantoinase B